MHVGTFCHASLQFFFRYYITRILFSAWWNILWLIRYFFFEVMNAVTLYCFLPDGTWCDALKQIFVLSIVCSDCTITVFCILEPSLINKNKFGFWVLRWQMQLFQEYYFLHVGTFCHESKQILFWSDECSNIAWLLFSNWWNILWCIKTNFLLKYCMQLLQEYCFPHVGTFSDEAKLI